MTTSVRVVRPLDGELPGAPSVRTAKTGHQVWSEIPVPERKPFGERYPWKEMAIGESFFVPLEEQPGGRHRLSSADQANRRLAPKQYRAVWSECDPGTKAPGYRVWRVR